MSVVRHGLRMIEIPRFSMLSSKEQNTALDLLSVPTLRIARVVDVPRVLRAVAKATALQDLTVGVHAKGSRPMGTTQLLLRSLSSLQLLKLQLVCRLPGSEWCPLRLIERLGDTRYALARRCPNLSDLHAYCSFHPGKPGWALWRTLRQLREVITLQDGVAEPPDCAIPRLRAMQSVRIMGMSHCGVTFAMRLGACVTHLRNRHHPTIAEEITALSECGRMSEMELLLEEGSESALLKTVCAMPNLRHLRLNWFLPEGTACRKIKFVYRRDARWPSLTSLYTVRYRDAGVMLRIIQQAHALTHVEILRVRIRVRDRGHLEAPGESTAALWGFLLRPTRVVVS